jgi:hypothetical protein
MSSLYESTKIKDVIRFDWKVSFAYPYYWNIFVYTTDRLIPGWIFVKNNIFISPYVIRHLFVKSLFAFTVSLDVKIRVHERPIQACVFIESIAKAFRKHVPAGTYK